MCPYPRAPQALAHRDTRFTSEQGDGSTESRPYFIVRVARFEDAYYLTSSYTINHNSMLHYTDALSRQRAMATALVLKADSGRTDTGQLVTQVLLLEVSHTTPINHSHRP